MRNVKYSDQSYNLRIELDTENCELKPGQLAKLQDGLAPLRRPVENFPVASLYVTIAFKPPSNDYRVKVVLQLPGRALATGDVDQDMYPAFRRSIRKLVHKVTAYKDRLQSAEELSKHEKGTHQAIVPQHTIDADALQEAVDQGDYARFRRLTYPFEEPVRKRAGRWIQRYPAIEAQLGSRFDLADIVEEVFLNAFERHGDRPRQVPFGEWLEQLIDPSVQLLAEDTEEELANIRFARSVLEADGGQPAS
jgi:ribosome-associated translation inhibitor RaiA